MYKKIFVIKCDVMAQVEYFNLILLIFPIVNYDQIYKRKTQPTSHNEMKVGVFFFFFEFSLCNTCINSSVRCKLIIFFNFSC